MVVHDIVNEIIRRFLDLIASLLASFFVKFLNGVLPLSHERHLPAYNYTITFQKRQKKICNRNNKINNKNIMYNVLVFHLKIVTYYTNQSFHQCFLKSLKQKVRNNFNCLFFYF